MTEKKKQSDSEEAGKKAPARKAASKKPAAKKTTTKKAATKKAATKKAATKKAATKKAATKKAAEGKTPATKKTPAEPKSSKRAAKPSAEKATPKPAPTRRSRQPSGELPIVRASARYVRIAPRKARLIADQVRGMEIDRARALLQFSPRGAAHDIHKLINSAASNAENNHDLIGDEMRIAQITVDEGPTLRRYRPRALGRATKINKRTCHISVALSPDSEDF